MWSNVYVCERVIVLCSNERVAPSFAHYLVAQYVSENKNTPTDAASFYIVLGLGVFRLMQLQKKKKKNLK